MGLRMGRLFGLLFLLLLLLCLLYCFLLFVLSKSADVVGLIAVLNGISGHVGLLTVVEHMNTALHGLLCLGVDGRAYHLNTVLLSVLALYGVLVALIEMEHTVYLVGLVM